MEAEQLPEPAEHPKLDVLLGYINDLVNTGRLKSEEARIISHLIADATEELVIISVGEQFGKGQTDQSR